MWSLAASLGKTKLPRVNSNDTGLKETFYPLPRWIKLILPVTPSINEYDAGIR